MKRVWWYGADGTVDVNEVVKCPSLEEMQKMVGGYIERIVVQFEGRDADMIVNEDGRLMHLSVNMRASEIAHRMIVGDVIVLDGLRLQ